VIDLTSNSIAPFSGSFGGISFGANALNNSAEGTLAPGQITNSFEVPSANGSGLLTAEIVSSTPIALTITDKNGAIVGTVNSVTQQAAPGLAGGWTGFNTSTFAGGPLKMTVSLAGGGVPGTDVSWTARFNSFGGAPQDAENRASGITEFNDGTKVFTSGLRVTPVDPGRSTNANTLNSDKNQSAESGN